LKVKPFPSRLCLMSNIWYWFLRSPPYFL
jgi:hypothetical protein